MSRLHLIPLISTAVDTGAYYDLTKSLHCLIACDCHQHRTLHTCSLHPGRLLMRWSANVNVDILKERRTICSLSSGSANIATKIMSESIAKNPWLTWGQRLGGVRLLFAILEKNNECELLDRKTDAVSQRCFYGLCRCQSKPPRIRNS
jgi:hypothetical protein